MAQSQIIQDYEVYVQLWDHLRSSFYELKTKGGSSESIIKALGQNSSKPEGKFSDEQKQSPESRWRWVSVKLDGAQTETTFFFGGTLKQLAFVGKGGDLSLGITFRLNLISRKLNLKNRTDLGNLIRQSDWAIEFDDASWTHLKSLLSTKTKRRPDQIRYSLKEYVYRLCFDQNEGLLGVNHLFVSSDALFDEKFTGPDAIGRFSAALDAGRHNSRRETDQPHLPDSALDPSIFHSKTDTKRDTLLKKIDAWICRTDAATPLIFNVHRKHTPSGLAASAKTVVHRHTQRVLQEPSGGSTDDRDIFYLPLSSVPARTTRKTMLTLPQVIARLHHFYHYGLGGEGDVEGFSETVPLAKKIEDIRTAMITRPGIVVLDAVHLYNEDTDQHASTSIIERVIADRHMLRLISRLATIPSASLKSEADLKAWRRNRIIVMSDLEIQSHGEIARYLPEKAILSEELPDPPAGVGKAILKTLNLSNETKIATRYHAHCEREFSDAHYWALDAVLTIYDRIVKNEYDNSLIASRKQSNFETRLIQDYIREISTGTDKSTVKLLDYFFKMMNGSRPLHARILLLIAMAPEGLRRSSLIRIARRSAKGGSKHAPITRKHIEAHGKLFETPKTDPTEVVKVAINELLELYPMLITETMPDPTIGIDGAGIEDPDAEKGEDTANSISFTLPETLFAARGLLTQYLDECTVLYSHRALADEAFRAAALAMRHVDITQAVSVRPWRWHIAGMLDGLRSIGLKPDSEEPGGWLFRDDVDLSGIASHGPTDPYEYYKWLYFFTFSQVFERRPLFRLSRKYGYMSLKQQMLTIFGRPAYAAGTGHPNEPFRGRAPEIFKESSGILARISGGSASDPLTMEMTRELVADYASSKARCHLARLELEKARETVAFGYRDCFAQNEASPPRRHPIYRKFMKLAFDRAILRTDAALDHLQALDAEVTSISDLLKCWLVADGHSTVKTLEGLLADHAQKTVKNVMRGTATEDEDWKMLNELDGFDTKIGSWVRTSLPKTPPEDLAAVADLITRVGEYCLSQSTLSTPICLHQRDERTSDPIRQLTEAHVQQKLGSINSLMPSSSMGEATYIATTSLGFSYLQFGEALRLSVFSMAPQSSGYMSHGMGIRAHVQALLRLQQIKRHREEPGHVLNEARPLLRRARKMIDVATRHLYAYPAERAALLVLEAQYMRIAARTPDDLEIARSHLAEAERIVHGQGRDYHSRLMLYAERFRLHLHCANTAQSASKSAFFEDLTSQDLLQLEQTAQVSRDAEKNDFWPCFVTLAKSWVSKADK